MLERYQLSKDGRLITQANIVICITDGYNVCKIHLELSRSLPQSHDMLAYSSALYQEHRKRF